MNTLSDLNSKLFDQMDKLSKEGISEEELEKEISRSETMIKLATVIISNGELALKAAKFKTTCWMQQLNYQKCWRANCE